MTFLTLKLFNTRFPIFLKQEPSGTLWFSKCTALPTRLTKKFHEVKLNDRSGKLLRACDLIIKEMLRRNNHLCCVSSSSILSTAALMWCARQPICPWIYTVVKQRHVNLHQSQFIVKIIVIVTMSFREVFHPKNHYRLIHLCTSVLKPKTGAVLNKVERMIMICPNYLPLSTGSEW